MERSAWLVQSTTFRASAALAALYVGATFGCEMPAREPAPGVEPRTTFDGLVYEAQPHRGSLFLKSGHGISSDHAYLVMDDVVLTYEPESLQFTTNEEERMREYVRLGVKALLADRGMALAREPGPCVLKAGIGLVDVFLNKPTTTGSSTNMLTSWGAITMVVDLRDSVTDEPLARYGHRVSIPGGVQWQEGRPAWVNVKQALDKALRDQNRILTQVIPESGMADPKCTSDVPVPTSPQR